MIPPYVLHLHGSYGAHNREALQTELDAAEHIGGIVVIDLRGVSVLDEETIAEFGKTRDRLRAAHGQLRLIIEDRMLEGRFHESADSKFDVYGSIEAATLDC